MRYTFLSGLVAAMGLSLIVLPACSSNSAQLTSLERRIAALEDEQHNFQAKQESLNTWEAGRLSKVEAKHPDIAVPPPPQYMLKETMPATTKPANPLQGGVVETNPGLARIEPTAAGAAPAAAQPALQANAQSMRVYPAPLPGTAPAPAPAAGQSSVTVSGVNAPLPTQTAQSAVAPAEAAKAAPLRTEQAAAQPAVPTPTAAPGGRVINPNAAPTPLKPTAAAQTSRPKAAPSGSASVQPGRTAGEKGEYASALRLVERGRNAEGRAALDKFMSKYPSSTLMPNAIYWKGETYYGEQNYQEAVLAFRDVTTRFPKTAKAADALLKIGMSYQKMGDSQNAKFYLEQLTNEFPNTRAANLAKQQLTKIP